MTNVIISLLGYGMLSALLDAHAVEGEGSRVSRQLVTAVHLQACLQLC